MTDVFSKNKRSEIMSKVHSKNTKPELAVRKFLFANKFRYRLHQKNLIGNPDIVLKKYNTVIFVNGCFWHGHNCKRGQLPKSNITYWSEKIKNNILRDKRNKKQLIESGWKVFTMWECQLDNESLNVLIKKIQETI